MGETAEAVRLFRRAAAPPAKSSLGRIAAARAAIAENRDAEAERVLRQTLALDPNNAMALDMMGTVLADSGRFDAARESYERAIAIAPPLAGSFYDLARCRRLTPADAGLLARMRAALDEPRLDATQRQRVHLALGKAADDLGDVADAMRQFDAAATLRRALAGFDPAAFAARVDRLIAAFTPNTIAAARENDGSRAVLIMGLPRSGTTLVEQIISAHPDVAGGGELPFWTGRGATWERNFGATLDTSFLAKAATDYAATLRAVSPTAARVTDKMPLNVLWAGLILAACPRATILHCRRHPIATALSIHQTFFNPRLAFPTGGEELVAYVRAHRRLADHWRTVLPPERFIEVDYEALVAAPEPTIRRVVDACGLGWNPACLHPEHNRRVVRTPSKWQARQPIHADAVERWRRYEPFLGPLAALSEAERPADLSGA